MKERPILFKGPLVRAVLEGRKTVTRRLIKPQPDRFLTSGREPWNIYGDTWGWSEEMSDGARACMSEDTMRCPYGARGDMLWVRETWALIDESAEQDDSNLVTHYRADTGDKYPGDWPSDEGDDPDCPRWKPSIHMRREHSRINLEITEVRVEQLQEITEAGARAEGCDPFDCTHMDPEQPLTDGSIAADFPTRTSFAMLWDEINGDRALFKANPYVWVVSFRKLT